MASPTKSSQTALIPTASRQIVTSPQQRQQSLPHTHERAPTLLPATLRDFLLESSRTQIYKDPGFPSFQNYAFSSGPVTLQSWQFKLIKEVAHTYNIPFDSEPSLERVCQQIKSARDNENLIRFFEALKEQISVKDPPKLNGSIKDKADAISSWMDLHRSTLSEIERLDLSFETMTSLTEKINLFAKLKFLNLAFNCITKLPNNLQLDNLEELNLKGNYDIAISNRVRLPKLKKLDLSTSDISSFPSGLRLPELQEINFTGCKHIYSLPHNLDLPKINAIITKDSFLYALPQNLSARKIRRVPFSEDSDTNILIQPANLRTFLLETFKDLTNEFVGYPDFQNYSSDPSAQNVKLTTKQFALIHNVARSFHITIDPNDTIDSICKKIKENRDDEMVILLFEAIEAQYKSILTRLPRKRGGSQDVANNIRKWFDEQQDITDQISVLHLHNKGFVTLPAAINKLRNLKLLNLAGNPINSLEILKSTDIEDLDLSYTYINTLGKNLNFSKLKRLDLSCSQINGLESGLQLPELMHLNISNTANLTFLPDDIHAPKLTTVHAKHNSLNKLPAWINPKNVS